MESRGNISCQEAPNTRPGITDPSLSSATATTLPADSQLQQAVRQCMSELQLADECPDETDEDTAPDSCASKFARKSGRLRIVDDVVVKDIEWLHYDVYCGQRRRPAQYEEHQQPAMHHHCDIQARIIKSCNKLTQGQVAYYMQDPVVLDTSAPARCPAQTMQSSSPAVITGV